MNKLISLLFSVTLLVGAQSSFAAEEVVATVNGKPIYKKQFDERFRQSMLFVSKKPVSKEEVLNDLINRELGIEKAQKDKLADNPIVKSKMQDVLYHAQISKDLEKKFNGIEVTDDAVEKYYKKYKEIRTRHILFRVRAEPSEEETTAALEQAMKIYGILKKKKDKFPELANKYSQSSTAGAGGDLGYQPAARYAPEYYDAIKDKKPGFISPPVRTQYGYHLIEVLAVKPYNEINMPLYRKLVYDEMRDGIIGTYFEKMRAEAKIKINKDKL
jgi:parvulin-like peptidyl-prolyl isomerase